LAQVSSGKTAPPWFRLRPRPALDQSEIAETLAAGLASELVFDLGRFDGFRLYAPAQGDETAPVLSELRRASVPTSKSCAAMF
jgi:hypothetical protein